MSNQVALSLVAGVLLSLLSVGLMALLTFKYFPDLFYFERLRANHYRIVFEPHGEYKVQWAYWWKPFTWNTYCGPTRYVSWGVYSSIPMRTLAEAEQALRDLQASLAWRPRSVAPVIKA